MPHFSFGSIAVDVYSDGELACPLLAMIPGADPAEFQRLGGCPDGEQLLMPMSSYLVRSGNKTLLVDTGVGADLGSLARAGFSGTSGLLPGALRDGGIDARDIDAVIFTHLHTDHIGWNVVDRDGDLAPMFPNAEYIVNRAEWAFWSATGRADIERCVRPLEAAGQLRAVDDGFEPAPGVSLLGTPGHTPGHVSVLMFDGGVGGVITGDAAHHPGEFENPELNPPYDSDPEQARRSRLALAERAEADGLVVLGGHFPAPGAGTLVRVESRRRWRWLGE